MAGNEEKQLLEYFHELSAEVDEVSEVKLNAAIYEGIGSRHRHRMALSARFTLGIAALLALLLLFVVPYIGDSQLQSSRISQASVPELNGYELNSSISGDNMTISSAITAGLIEPVEGAVLEKDGYVLKVDSMAADRKGIIIFYSLHNMTGQEVQISQLSLLDEDHAPVILPASWGRQTAKPGETLKLTERLLWSGDYAGLPDKIYAELNVGPKALNASSLVELPDDNSTELTVAVQLDKEVIAKAGKVLNIGETLSVSGQKIKINHAFVSTTGIYLDVSYDASNSEEIFGLIRPSLLLYSGDDTTWLYSHRTINLNGTQTYIFPNDNASSEPLKLQIEGIIALDKTSLKLVINTEQRQVLQGGDERLKVSALTEGRRIVLEYHRPALRGVSDTTNVILDDQFTDGAGKIHYISGKDIDLPALGTAAENEEIPPYQYGYLLKEEDLPQPLTFTLISYPDAVKEKASLTIRQ